MRNNKGLTAFAHIFFVLAVICVAFPLFAVIMISFSTESDVIKYGFQLIPRHLTTAAYKAVFSQAGGVIRAVGVTVVSAVSSSVLLVLLSASFAYVLSQPKFEYKKLLTVFFLIPMFFNGGLIPTYILITQYLHLGNTIFVYVFTGLFNFGNVLLLRASFQQVPKELMESSQIDGANQMTVFFKIMIPLSASMIAMIFCMNLLSRWNDFQTSLYYIDDSNLYTIQYLLQKTLQEVQIRNQTYAEVAGYAVEPSLTLQYAMSVIAALPVFVAFPFMQKYFSKGITVGSVKG